MSKQIAIPQAAAQALKIGQKQSIKLSKGQHVRVQDLLEGQTKDAANVVATKSGKGLNLKFADGTEVLFDNFYEVCAGNACSVTVAGKGAAGYTITGDSAVGAATQDGGQMVYAYGAQTSLMDMARVDTNVAKALGGLGEGTVSYIPEASGMGMGTVLGVIGGALGVAAAASSSSSKAVEQPVAVKPPVVETPPIAVEPPHTFIDGSFMAGPVVAGHGLKAIAYNPVDGTVLAEGELNDDGSFSIDLGVYVGTVLVRVSDKDDTADYFDEATGAPMDLSAELRAMTYATGAGTIKVNVNVFTEVAVKVLENGAKLDGENNIFSGTEADIADANSKVAAALGLTQNLVTGDAPVAVVNVDGSANTDANAYGKLLAAASGLDVNSSTDQSLEALLAAIDSTEAMAKLILEGFAQTLDAATSKFTLDLTQVTYMINGIQNAIDSLNEEVSTNAADILDLTDKYAELKLALDTLEAIVNGDAETEGTVDYRIAELNNALDAALEEAVIYLEGLIGELAGDLAEGDYSTVKDLSDALQALEGVVNGDAETEGTVDYRIAALQTELNLALETAVGELEEQIGALAGDLAEGDYSTVKDLSDALQALEGVVNGDAETEGTVDYRIAALQTELNLALETAVGELEEQIGALAGDLAEGDYSTVKALSDALQALEGVVNGDADTEGTVDYRIAALQTELNLALETAVGELEEQIGALAGDLAEGDYSTVKDLSDALQALEGVVNGDAETEGTVDYRIAALQTELNLALETAVGELEEQIGALAGDLAEGDYSTVKDLSDALQALEGVVNGDAETEGTVDYRIAAMNSSMEEALDAAVLALEEQIGALAGDLAEGDYSTVKDLSDALQALEGVVNGDAETEGTVDYRIAALQTELNLALETAVGELEEQIGALAGDLVEGDYSTVKDLSDALQALEGVVNGDAETEGTVDYRIAALQTELTLALEAAVLDLEEQIADLAGDLSEAAYTTVQALSEQAVILDDIVNGDASVEGTVDYRIAALRTELDARISFLESKLDLIAPEITDIVISAEGADADGNYGEGDVVTVKVSFDESVLVTGDPTFELLVGEDIVEAELVSGAGTDELVFQYTLTADQYDADGISAGEDALHLNEGSIKDAARNDAVITSEAIANGEDLIVDNGPLTLDTSVAGIFGNGLTIDNVVFGIDINSLGDNTGLFYLSDLDSNGQLTVPDGAVFLNIDDYFSAIFQQQLNEEDFKPGPITFTPDLSNQLALPLPGLPFYILASPQVLSYFVQMSLGNPEFNFLDPNDFPNEEAWLTAMGAVSVDQLSSSGSGISDLGTEITQDFLDLTQGREPSEVTLNISGYLTVAQAVALKNAGFDLEFNATYNIRDWDTTVSGANSSPDSISVLQGADQVVAMGDELDNESMRFNAFDQNVNLRVEAGAGNDRLEMGRGDDEIVGGLGGDTINLTTNDSSYDDVIYQTVRDGQTLPVSSIRFVEYSETDGYDLDNYREGAVLTVTINGQSYSHTVSTEDIQDNPDAWTIQNELEAFAEELTEQLVAVDTRDAVVGFLFDWNMNGMEEITVGDMVDGKSYTVPAGHFFVPADMALFTDMDFSDNMYLWFASIKGGQCFTLTDEQVFNLNDVNEGGLIMATEVAVDSWLSSNDYTGYTADDLLSVYPGELSGVTAYNGVLTFYGLAGETLEVEAGGDGPDHYMDAIENDGLVTSIVVEFSDNEADWPTTTNGDHTTEFTRQLHVTVDGFEVTSDIVYVDGELDMTASMEAMQDAILAAMESEDITCLSDVLLTGNALTLVGNQVPAVDEDAPMFSVDSAVIDQNGVQQVTRVSFSDDNADYYEGGFLSVVVGGELVEVPMVAGNAYQSVSDLADAVNEMALDSLESAELNGDSTEIYFVANTEESDPLQVEAKLDFQGEQQQSTIELMDAEFYDWGCETPVGAEIYYDGGEVWVEVQTAGEDGILFTDDDDYYDISAAMGEDAAQTSQNLVDAINNNVDLEGLFGDVSYNEASGEIVLTASAFGKETFAINDVTLDYQGVYQKAYVDYSNTSDDDYYEGGTLSLEIDITPWDTSDSENNVIVTVDMVAGNAQASIDALAAEIENQILSAATEEPAVVVIPGDFSRADYNYDFSGSTYFALDWGITIRERSYDSYYYQSSGGSGWWAGTGPSFNEAPLYWTEREGDTSSFASLGAFLDYVSGLQGIDTAVINADNDIVITTDRTGGDVSLYVYTGGILLNQTNTSFFGYNQELDNPNTTGESDQWFGDGYSPSVVFGDAVGDASTDDSGWLTLTSADTDPQLFTIVSAKLSTPGVLQEATLTYSTFDADYFTGGTIQAVINGETVVVDMVAGDAEQTLLDLKDAIENYSGANALHVGNVSLSGGTLTLVADEPANNAEQMAVDSVSIDVEAVTQITEIDFSALTDDDFFVSDDAVPPNSGYVTISIDGVTVTADMADTKADTLLNLKAEIEWMRDEEGLTSVGTVEIVGDSIVLTASEGGALPNWVDTSSFEIPTPYINGEIEEFSIQFSNTFLDADSILGETITVVIDGVTSTVVVDQGVLDGVTGDRSEYLTGLVWDQIYADHEGSDSNLDLDAISQDGNILYFQSIDRGLNILGELDASVTKNDGLVNNPVAAILEMINPGVDDQEAGMVNVGDMIVVNDETGEGEFAVTGEDLYTVTYDGSDWTATLDHSIDPELELSLNEESVSGVNDDPYNQYIENADYYDDQGTDSDCWNNGDYESTGWDGGVTQTYTNPGSGYDALADGDFDGNAQWFEEWKLNDGDADLYGSDPGQYTDDGLETTWLNGGTQTDTDFYGVDGDGNQADRIDIGDGSGDDGGEAGMAADDLADSDDEEDNFYIWTEDNGFAAYDWDSTYTVVKSTGNDEPDTINGFQVGGWVGEDYQGDTIALEGALLQSTLGEDDYVAVVNPEYWDFEADFDLSNDEFGLVTSNVSWLSDTEIRDAKLVAEMLSDVFWFDATDDNGEINTSVFAVTSGDDQTITAIWAHEQSTSWDSTVDSFELNLLAVVHTTNNQEFNENNFAQFRDQLFPV